MTTPSALRWLAPPDLPGADLARRARALWIASWPFIAVVTVTLGVAVLVEPDTLIRRATTVATVATLIILLHAISRSGRPLLASWLLVLGLSIIVTQRAWITGGIHAPVAVFYALFIVMGGMLIGVRGSLVTALVSLAGAVVLTIGTVFGWLATRPGVGSAYAAFVLVILAIGLALVTQALVNLRQQRSALGPDAVTMFVHDFRSPLLVLLAQLDLLRGNVEAEHREDVNTAMESATMLRQLTTNLLDVSRLEAGQMPVRRVPTDLSALINSVVAGLRILQPGRKITIDIGSDASCSSDPELMRRVIENLVTNAMKHTDLPGHIRVAVSGSPGSARVEVQDEGPGIPPELRPRLFEPYTAGDLRSRSGHESSGLGLAFCRAAVQALGGTIRFDDTARGTTFIIELPR